MIYSGALWDKGFIHYRNSLYSYNGEVRNWRSEVWEGRKNWRLGKEPPGDQVQMAKLEP